VLNCSVKNTGNVAGKEVLQLYVEAPQGKLGKPARALCAFEKSDLLAPNQSQKIRFEVSHLPQQFRTTNIPEYHYIARGCEECYYTGYHGRKAIYEVIPIDLELSNLIKQNSSNIEKFKHEKKILSLAETAYNDFILGNTSLEEIYPILLNNL
jgi:general secretion pathway protein E/type IV pilus assembly protein PilB